MNPELAKSKWALHSCSSILRYAGARRLATLLLRYVVDDRSHKHRVAFRPA